MKKYKSKIKNCKLNNAFSIIEVIMSMGLFILLSGIGLGAYFTYYQGGIIRTDVNKAVTIIKETRFAALKNPTNSDYGIYLYDGAQEITAFKGSSVDDYIPGDPENRIAELERLNVTNISLQPYSDTQVIIFSKQTGKTENYGSFTISNGDFSYRITINEQGVIN